MTRVSLCSALIIDWQSSAASCPKMMDVEGTGKSCSLSLSLFLFSRERTAGKTSGREKLACLLQVSSKYNIVWIARKEILHDRSTPKFLSSYIFMYLFFTYPAKYRKENCRMYRVSSRMLRHCSSTRYLYLLCKIFSLTNFAFLSISKIEIKSNNKKQSIDIFIT